MCVIHIVYLANCEFVIHPPPNSIFVYYLCLDSVVANYIITPNYTYNAWHSHVVIPQNGFTFSFSEEGSLLSSSSSGNLLRPSVIYWFEGVFYFPFVQHICSNITYLFIRFSFSCGSYVSALLSLSSTGPHSSFSSVSPFNRNLISR